MLTISVSALRGGEAPEPGPAVINSIRRKHLDAWIVGFSYDPLDSGFYADGRGRINRGYLVPHPTKGPSALLERIDDIIRDQPLDMIIPNADIELPNYLDIVGELNDRGIKLGIPSRSAFERRGKENLYKLCKSARIKSPKTILVDSVEAAQDAAAEIGFPVMIKSRMYGAAQANAPIDVAPVYHHMHATQGIWGGPFLVQEL